MHVEVIVRVRKDNAYDFKNVEEAEFGIEGSMPVLMAAGLGPACGRLIQDTIKRASRIFNKREVQEAAAAKAAAETEALAVAQEEEAKRPQYGEGDEPTE